MALIIVIFNGDGSGRDVTLVAVYAPLSMLLLVLFFFTNNNDTPIIANCINAIKTICHCND